MPEIRATQIFSAVFFPPGSIHINSLKNTEPSMFALIY